MIERIVSFGFKYGGPNSAEGAIFDVRKHFPKNPYRRKDLRYLRGTDESVARDIENVPFFEENYQKFKARVLKADTETVFLGCTSGHHRSVYMAERLAQELHCRVSHRDIGRK